MDTLKEHGSHSPFGQKVSFEFHGWNSVSGIHEKRITPRSIPAFSKILFPSSFLPEFQEFSVKLLNCLYIGDSTLFYFLSPSTRNICSICPHFERSGIFARMESVHSKRAVVMMELQSILSKPFHLQSFLLSSYFSQLSQLHVSSLLKKAPSSTK